MTSRRNLIMDEVLALLRAGSDEYLSSLHDEGEITRGPPAIGDLTDWDMKERRLWADIEGDDIAPGTVSRETHNMVFAVMVAIRSYKTPEDAIQEAVEFGDEVERAILADRTLGGQAEECHPLQFSPGIATSDNEQLAICRIRFACRFTTTN